MFLITLSRTASVSSFVIPSGSSERHRGKSSRRFSRWRTRHVDIISSFPVLSSHCSSSRLHLLVICLQKSRPSLPVTMFARLYTPPPMATTINRLFLLCKSYAALLGTKFARLVWNMTMEVRSHKFFNHGATFSILLDGQGTFVRQGRGSIFLCLTLNNAGSLRSQKIGRYNEPTLIYCYTLNGGAQLTLHQPFWMGR